MTDNELKFYDPETGAELPRVPRGGVIKKRTPYGYVQPDGVRGWVDIGRPYDLEQGDGTARFTREPIAPPSPPLPTEPGYYLDKDGDLWHVNDSGERAILVVGERALENRYYPWGYDDRRYAPFAPVTLVPTDTWDRLRVLDPEDTRDRVDANGVTWTREGGGWLPDAKSAALRCYMSLENIPGPLRFADEVSDR